MVKELIIHLGDCKTGSTAIQSTLLKKRYTMPDQSLVYPTGFNHNPLAWTLSQLSRRQDQKKFREKRFRFLAEKLAASDADFGIVSAEDFEFVQPRDLAAALEEFLPDYKGRTRLVAYVRPHAGRLLSSFAEHLKQTGEDVSMRDFFAQRRRGRHFTYADRFCEWRDVFGEAYTLRPFVRDRFKDGDVVADFFDIVTGGAEVALKKVPIDNSSLSLRNLMMFKVLHQRLRARTKFTDQQLHWFKQVTGWQMAPHMARSEPDTATRLVMNHKLTEVVRDACRADAERLDAEFFDDSGVMVRELEAAPEKARAEGQSLRPADHLSEEEMGMIRGWADFLAQIALADIDHYAWAIQPPGTRPGKPPGARPDLEKSEPKPEGEQALIRRLFSKFR